MTGPSKKRARLFKIALSGAFWVAFLALFVPFYQETLLAGVFAFAMAPFLRRHWRRNRFLAYRKGIALTLILMVTLLLVPLTAIAYKAYRYVRAISVTGFQNTPIYLKTSALKIQALEVANRLLEKVGLREQVDLPGMVEGALNRAVNVALGAFSAFATELPDLLLSLFIFVIAIYFFLGQASSLRRIVSRQRVLTHRELNRLLSILQTSSYNAVVSSVLIALLQASLVAAGSLILQSGDVVVIWAITFFCSFVPIIGAGPVAFALGVGQALLGDYPRAIGFVVLSAVVGTVDNLIRPYLIAAGADDLHPIVSLVSIIGALILFGMPGLFLGPVIASVAVRIIPTLFNEPEALITASGRDLAKTTP